MGLSARLKANAIDLLLGARVTRAEQRLRRMLGAGDRIELYHQLDDPYSYLALQILPRLADAGLAIDLVVVPAPELAVDPEPELRQRYGMRDCAAIAARFEVSFPADASVPRAPTVMRAAAVLGVERPAREQLDLALRLTRAVWEGDHDEVERLAGAHGVVDDVEVSLAKARAKQRRRGHYQGGMFRYAGGWYWAVDRLATLSEDLRLAGHDLPAPLLVPRRDPPVVDAPEADELELYFSFRSPYSYLALDRCAVLAARYGIPLRIKPVLPMVMRGLAVPRIKRLYLARDAAREARRLGLPFGKICDPLGLGVERCLALFGYAEQQGAAYAFCSSAARGIWSEAMDVTRDDELATIVRRAGSSWSEARPWLSDEGWRGRAERHRAELRAMGLWGVPVFCLGAVTLWGQDRLDRLEEHLRAWAAARGTA